MQQDLTDIVVVLDRSGSMQSCRDDAEGGLNAFIEDQKKRPGNAVFTLVQFDTEYEFVHRGVPIFDVPQHTLVPRGSTALLDAVGRAINETGDRIARTPEAERPGLVAFVILTDGQENSSMEFTKDQIRTMIQHQTDVYKWQFTFLGANQDAFVEARGIGITADKAAHYAAHKTRSAFDAVSQKMGRMRAAAAKGEEVKPDFTAKEIAEMDD
jgi:Mg-chelatase subunit ChlD